MSPTSCALAEKQIAHALPMAKRRMQIGHSLCTVEAAMTESGPLVSVSWSGKRPTAGAEVQARGLVADVLCAVALGAFWSRG